MKNTIFIIIIIACVGLIAYGLIGKKPAQPASNYAAGLIAPESESETPQTQATTAPAAIGQVANRYRPDTAEPVNGDAMTLGGQAERDFQITPELLAKMYLIDVYKPGTCFGAPVAVPQIAITNLVNSNPPLTSYLRQKYSLKTDLETYNKIKQLQGIKLTETASSNYSFTFVDGQCQNVTYYEGTVKVSGASVSAVVTNQASHTYQ